MNRTQLIAPFLGLALAAGPLLVGCGGTSSTPSVSATPEGKLCGRAYNQTRSFFDDLLTQRGIDAKGWPDKEAYVEACVAADFSDEQAKCLDPKWYSVDAEGCKSALSGKEAEKKKLETMFADAIGGKVSAEKEPAEGKAAKGGEAGATSKSKVKGTAKPEEDVGSAVQDALGG